MSPHPILVLACHRPQHLRSLLESLQGALAVDASPRLVVIAQDGPGHIDGDDHRATTAVAEAFVAGRPEATRLLVRPQRLGLRGNVTRSVTEMLADHPTVLVLEDDLRVNACSLAWFDQALSAYADDDHVATVQGYVPPGALAGTTGVFLQGADSWGWGTWRRAWSLYREDIDTLAAALPRHPAFPHFRHGSQAHWDQTLRLTRAGRRDSWAVRWRASLLLAGRLSLYPPVPMVTNEGHDGTGAHCTISRTYAAALPAFVPALPAIRAWDPQAQMALAAWHRRHNHLLIRARRRLLTMLLQARGRVLGRPMGKRSHG